MGTIDEYWQELAGSGWLDELSPSEQERLREQLRDAFARNLFDVALLAHFTVANDYLEGYGPSSERTTYHNLIGGLAEASGGEFQPARILDEWEYHKGVAHVGFFASGRDYRIDVLLDGNLIDLGVVRLVNEALGAGGGRRRFRILPVAGAGLHIAFVSPGSFERALRAGLLEPATYPGGGLGEPETDVEVLDY